MYNLSFSHYIIINSI